MTSKKAFSSILLNSQIYRISRGNLGHWIAKQRTSRVKFVTCVERMLIIWEGTLRSSDILMVVHNPQQT